MKRTFHALIGDKRERAALSFVLLPFLFVSFVTWGDRGSFWPQKLSFLEGAFFCVMLVLGGRLWDLQHKADKTEEQAQHITEKLGELQRALDLNGALGDQLLQIKAVLLDVTEQLCAVEHKIDSLSASP